MQDFRYFGTYATFTAPDKQTGELLQGADFIVGDAFDLVLRTGESADEGAVGAVADESAGGAGDNAATRANDGAAASAPTELPGEIVWVRNRFGGFAGYLDSETSRQVRLMQARGHTVRALLSLVAFTDTPDPGFYWGQVAIFGYDPAFEQAFSAWEAALSAKLAEGARVQVALSPAEVDKVLESGGTWLPTARADIPKPEVGKTAILKQTRSLSERMIELGRARRPGCLVVGWVFNIALVAGLIWLVVRLLS